MNVSATNLAHQGIQSGFKKLAENTEQLNPNSTTAQSPVPDDKEDTVQKLSAEAPTQSLEEMLLSNNKTQTQIESLAKVIKTEDKLIGQLFEDWA